MSVSSSVLSNSAGLWIQMKFEKYSCHLACGAGTRTHTVCATLFTVVVRVHALVSVCLCVLVSHRHYKNVVGVVVMFIPLLLFRIFGVYFYRPFTDFQYSFSFIRSILLPVVAVVLCYSACTLLHSQLCVCVPYIHSSPISHVFPFQMNSTCVYTFLCFRARAIIHSYTGCPTFEL